MSQEIASLESLGIWKYILAGEGIGVFKGQFVLYFLAQHLPSAKLRAECSLILYNVWNAGWGCGVALSKLAPSCRDLLAIHQKD
eukprot:1927556-Karenia_brevis.AAC.1